MVERRKRSHSVGVTQRFPITYAEAARAAANGTKTSEDKSESTTAARKPTVLLLSPTPRVKSANNTGVPPLVLDDAADRAQDRRFSVASELSLSPLLATSALETVPRFYVANKRKAAQPPQPATDEQVARTTEIASAWLTQSPSSWEALRRVWKHEMIPSTYTNHTEWTAAQRIDNFIGIIPYLERFLCVGVLCCLDALLFLFALLPLRLFRHVVSFVRHLHWPAQARVDFLRMLMLVVATGVLLSVDTSRFYHFVRGQSVLKLYVMFNMLFLLDRLLCALGEDLRDICFHGDRRTVYVLLCTAYVVLHSALLFMNMVTLNVTINSDPSVLFALLVSHNFGEIKGTVFKKFTKTNLFQVAAGDVVERFQLGLYMCAIFVQNLTALRASVFSPIDRFCQWIDNLANAEIWHTCGADLSVADTISMVIVSVMRVIQQLNVTSLSQNLGPWVATAAFAALALFVVELCIDWVKHGFVTKFNNLRPSVYQGYELILCADYVSRRVDVADASQRLDHAHALSKRLGFSSMPLAAVMLRVLYVSIQRMRAPLWNKLGVALLLFAGALIAKLLLSVLLARYCATRVVEAEQRRQLRAHLKDFRKVDRYAMCDKRIPIF
ncbi:MAG: hypothetical protein MHM6MM_003985 [Cercozoa sp. M6MM]